MMSAAKRASTAGYVIVAAFASLIAAFPLYWVISTSFKRPVDVFQFPPKLFFSPTLENYRSVIGNNFGSYFVHSVLISVGALIISMAVGVPAAYALSRSAMRHKDGIDFFILATRMAPPIVLLLPFYALWAHLRLIDTYVGLIAVYVSFTLAFVIWMMRASFDAVPRELDEAAAIDGCNHWGSFFRVILPSTRGSLTATVILSILLTWNEFLYALVLTSVRTETMPVAVAGYIGFDKINWGGLSAAATIIVMPVLVFALVVQKYLVRGLVGGEGN